MIDNYLKILEDSLCKKLTVLDEIAEYNVAQEELLKKEELSIDELDENMEQKDVLIKKHGTLIMDMTLQKKQLMR